MSPAFHGWGTTTVHDADLPGAPEVATIVPGGARTELPDALARTLAALAALTRLAIVPWYQARAVYLAIIESYLGVEVRHEVENLLPPIQGAADPLVALAVIARSTARTWERERPAIVEPLLRLAAKLDPELQGRRSTRADVAPLGCPQKIHRGPCRCGLPSEAEDEAADDARSARGGEAP